MPLWAIFILKLPQCGLLAFPHPCYYAKSLCTAVCSASSLLLEHCFRGPSPLLFVRGADIRLSPLFLACIPSIIRSFFVYF
jgi:hypothetical protein